MPDQGCSEVLRDARALTLRDEPLASAVEHGPMQLRVEAAQVGIPFHHGEICGLMAEDITAKGNLGRFISIRPNAVRLLKSKAAEREVPLHGVLENLLDMALPTSGRLFPQLTVDRVVKRYASLRRRHPGLRGTVFHSTRKWFITQCERTGVPEHFTASLVGHHSARSANKLTYGLYSAGISDAQKREIVEGVRVPAELAL